MISFSVDFWYAGIGAALIALSLLAFLLSKRLLKKLLAFNIMGSGVFLMMVGMAQTQNDGAADAVPQALVLTGIVVAVSATALALVVIRRFALASVVAALAAENKAAENDAAENDAAEKNGAERTGSDTAVSDTTVTDTALTDPNLNKNGDPQ
ncbi:MAG: NADH-quinone oxidoreductase subunit K [Idiomarina sp.]|nr:NADH-quinone oxidoreductase subunit K [Idiomarina sp.]